MPFRRQPPAEIVRAANRLRAARAETSRLKLPLTPDAMRLQPPLPPSQNAAPIYRQMMALYDAAAKFRNLEKPAWAGYLTRTRTDADRKAAKEALAQDAEMLRLAEKAATLPRCDFARPWQDDLGVLFREYPAIRYVARLLGARVVAQVESNAPMAAVETLRLAGVMARHLEEPGLITFLNRCTVLQTVYQPSLDLLAAHGSRDDVMAAMERTERAFDNLADLVPFLRGEVWGGVSFLRDIRTGKTTWKDLGRDDRPPPDFAPDPPEAERVVYADAWEARFLECFNELFDAFQRPDITARIQCDMAKQIVRGYQERFLSGDKSCLAAAILPPVFVTAFIRAMWVATEIRLRRVAEVAIKERLRTGQFPDDLPVLLNDPFNDRLLHYQRDGDAFVVYSVGQNQTDDGGDMSRDPAARLAPFTKDIAIAFTWKRR